MPGFVVRFVCSVVLLAASGGLWAQVGAAAPYGVSLPVADTRAATRDQAFSDALAQVLARLGGGADLQDRPGYADALKQASASVVGYQYQQADGAMSLDVRFDGAVVQRLLRQLSPKAVPARPPLLLAVRGADGQLLDAPALAPLSEAAATRGYLLAYATAPPAADDAASLAALGQRYHTGLVLSGQLTAGQSSWTLYTGGTPQHWSDQGGQSEMLSAAGESAADRVGNSLNVVSTGSSQGILWVGGLNSAEDYAQCVALLRGESAVTTLGIAEADEQGMRFHLAATLPLNSLAALLAAQGHFQQAPAQAGAAASLRWMP